ncbi:unnamed protein product, partial [Taenia asiatica]|uniref:SRCR domain-containing protein n=1 Tax=Taenia asiatica TaxID=60517 RepID=A0A0R3WFP0_TAEAS
ASSSELFAGVLLASANLPTGRVGRRTASPTLSSPPTTTAVPGDLILLQDVSNQHNLSTEQQCIMGEERQRLEAFVSRAHAECSTTTANLASSGVDRLQLSPDPASGGSASKAATSSNLFDVFSLQPGLHFAHLITNPNNPLLPSNPSGWSAIATHHYCGKRLGQSFGLNRRSLVCLQHKHYGWEYECQLDWSCQAQAAALAAVNWWGDWTAACFCNESPGSTRRCTAAHSCQQSSSHESGQFSFSFQSR